MTKLDFENLLRRNGYKYYELTEDDKEAGAGWWYEHRGWMHKCDPDADTDVAFRTSPRTVTWMSMKCDDARLEFPVDNVETVNNFLRLFGVAELTGYGEDMEVDMQPYDGKEN